MNDGDSPCSDVYNGPNPVVHCLGRVESMWLLVSVSFFGEPDPRRGT